MTNYIIIVKVVFLPITKTRRIGNTKFSVILSGAVAIVVPNILVGAATRLTELIIDYRARLST